jgi:hypothetical protein
MKYSKENHFGVYKRMQDAVRAARICRRLVFGKWRRNSQQYVDEPSARDAWT